MNIFEIIKQQITEKGLTVASFDFDRPWGGFFVIDEEQAQLFANAYFKGLNVEELRVAGKLSPKILVVKPGARLSWQYHHRRAETWRVIQGPIGIITSQDDTEGSIVRCEEGTTLVLHKEERHRLIGLNEWGVVAEFWQHTDVLNPSDEDDIVRVQDDYSRK